MAGVLYDGPFDWWADRDKDGHREYHVVWRVKTTSTLDGPAIVMTTPGLPLPGSLWLVDNDIDLWAWCRQDMTVKRYQPREGERSLEWTVEQTFSTKPDKKCGEQQFEDPLLEPQKVSGSYTKVTVEGTMDRFGDPIVFSSWEPIRGAQNEWDDAYPQVVVEQNVALLEYPLITAMKNKVNQFSLWGFDPRCVKLSDINWEKKWYGFCYFYYTRKFTFDINPATWDRDIVDRGTKALRGDWDRVDTSPTYRQYVLHEDVKDDPEAHLNPLNFTKFKDWYGENSETILNGEGRPWDPGTMTGETGTGTGADTEQGHVFIEYYKEADLVELGIPLDF